MRYTLIILSVIILTGLSFYSGLLIKANVIASQPTADIKSWKAKKELPELSRWQDSLASLQAALEIDPLNPEYNESVAMLYRYQARSFAADSTQANLANREALKRYQFLTRLRPSWGPYWGGIVSVKYDLWEYDQQMLSAMKNAARLAPWFRSSQNIILRAGFHGWPFLDAETRLIVTQTLDRAMEYQPNRTISIAIKQSYEERVLPYIAEDEKLRKVYEKELVAWQRRKK